MRPIHALAFLLPFALTLPRQAGAQTTPAAQPAKATATKTEAKPATVPAKPQTGDHGPINWVTVEQAMELSRKDGKPIMIDVFTQWCGPCKMLSSRTFTDKQLADYVNSHYHAVKFDAEGSEVVKFKDQTYTNPGYQANMQGMRNSTHQFTQVIAPVNGRIAYPTVVYLDAQGQILAPVQGYLTPEQMEPILIYFGEGQYKSKDYETFKAGFTTRRTAQ
jgi:thioredoxin-related protein